MAPNPGHRPVTWCLWTLLRPQVWLSVQISSCVDISARKHSQLTQTSEVILLSDPLALSYTTSWLFQKQISCAGWGWGETGAEYLYVNCGYNLSSLPSGSLSEFSRMHVTHTDACAPGSGTWLAVLPPCFQFQEQLQWGWGGREVLRAQARHCISPCVSSAVLDLCWTVGNSGLV